MGCRRRRSARGRQVVFQGSASRGSKFTCRTSLTGWYGILVFAAVLAAACGSDTAAPEIPEQLTIAFPEGTGVTADLGASQLARSLSVEGLTLIAADGRVTPRLATEWKWVDPLTLRVTMLPNVKLHNGKTLDAELAATILRSEMALASRRGQYPSFADVASVRADGETTLLFTLARHSWWLPEDLTMPLSIKYGPKENELEYGTGPYQVKEKTESGVFLERFDAYHRGRPGVARVEVRAENTLRTAWASLLRGDVDMVADLPPDTVELIRDENVRIMPFPRAYHYLIGFNFRLPKFADPRIRQALNLAINRAEIVTNVLKGAGIPSTGPVWPQHWASDQSGNAMPFAPARAEALLAAAGLTMRESQDPKVPPARLRLTCLMPEGFIVYEHLALDVQRQLAKIGVDIRFDVQPFDIWEKRALAGDYETVMVDLASGPGLSRASVFWRSPHEPYTRREFSYHNPETEALFKSLGAATSDTDVRSITPRLQDAFRRNPPAIFLAWNERARTVRGDFPITVESRTDPLPYLWQWGTNHPDRAAVR